MNLIKLGGIHLNVFMNTDFSDFEKLYIIQVKCFYAPGKYPISIGM